jgi:uncharacterized protein YfkK (UPF0435 family)
MDTGVFYNNGVLNKNKIRESWISNNLNDLYSSVLIFIKDNNINKSEVKFSKILYDYFNKIESTPKCLECNCKEKRFIGFNDGYDNFCSRKCASLNSKEKSIKLRRENTLKKWGVTHTSKLKSVKEKQLKTNLEKYGAPSPTQNISIRKKQRKTMLENWGVEYSGKSKLLMSKSLKTRFNKYEKSIKELYSGLDIVNIPKEGTLTIKCNLCQKDYTIKTELLRLRYLRYKIEPCLNCNPLSSYKYTSQNDIYDFIQSNTNFEIIKGDRKILNGKEIDIYIPHLKLAFEFNGLYWHSDLFKEKNYHLDKKVKCEELGINLIHIWEDDWLHKREIVESRIINLLDNSKKIAARKCLVKEVDSKLAKEFNNNNHLQGNINSSYRIGLFYKGDLVSLMTFGKARRSLGSKSSDDEWELYRFCNKKGHNVNGSFTKLLKFFEINKGPKMIISYANRDWSIINNNVYIKSGFIFEKTTQVNYWYFKDIKREHRFNWRKDKLLKLGYNGNTELDIMTKLGYNRVYDCGSLKYKKEY